MGKKLLLLLLILLTAGWIVVAFTNGAVLRSLGDALSGWLEPEVSIHTGEVDVRTDATDYLSGEDIGVSVSNLLEVPVRTHVGSATPIAAIDHAERKFSDGSWQREEVLCTPPHCTYVIDSPYPLDPGETRSFRWKPVFFTKGTAERRPVPPGVYRLLVRYQVQPDPAVPKWVWHHTLTNEFTVR